MDKKYRIKPYDEINDIWILQEKFCSFFWRGIGAGSKRKLQEFIDQTSAK